MTVKANVFLAYIALVLWQDHGVSNGSDEPIEKSFNVPRASPSTGDAK
jgi:hypothetical protein